MLNYNDITLDIFNQPVYVKLCTTTYDYKTIPALVISQTPITANEVYRKNDVTDDLWKIHKYWDKTNENVGVIANEIQGIVEECLTETDLNTLKELVFGIVLDARQMLGI